MAFSQFCEIIYYTTLNEQIRPNSQKAVMKKYSLIAPLALGASLAVVIPTHAQLIVSDGFNYPVASGSTALGGQNGGTGWGTATWTDKGSLSQIVAGSLSYTDGSGNTLATSGNSLLAQSSTSSSTEGQRVLPGTFGALAGANTASPGSLWVSFLWQGLNTTGSGTGYYRQASVMFLAGSTASSGSGKEFLDIGMPNISAANVATVNPNISLFAANGITTASSPSSLAPLQSTVAGNNGLTDFILMEVTGSFTAGVADTVNVWIDPTLGGTPTTAPQLTFTGQAMTTVNAIRIQSGGVNATYGAVSGQQQVDEINVGDTAIDVEPQAAPEPTALALAAIGGLSLLAWKRKRF